MLLVLSSTTANPFAPQRLEAAQAILNRVETRDLYKSVDLKVFHWDMKAKLKAAFTPESVVNAFKKLYQNRTMLSVADAEAVERAGFELFEGDVVEGWGVVAVSSH